MVGFEGGGPVSMVPAARVKAINPNYPKLIVREIDVLPRSDGRNWNVGDQVSLHEGFWSERNDARVCAVITEIIHAYD
jgi:hypothetical protein